MRAVDHRGRARLAGRVRVAELGPFRLFEAPNAVAGGGRRAGGAKAPLAMGHAVGLRRQCETHPMIPVEHGYDIKIHFIIHALKFI